MVCLAGFLDFVDTLGGRAADILGRRRLLVAGTALFGLSSLTVGLSGSETMLIGARLAQGVGAAMMTPAALSILTTSFSEVRAALLADVQLVAEHGRVFFGRLTDKAVRRGIFHSVPDLADAIDAYLTAHNDDPKPFQWTATTDQILEKVRSGRVTLAAQSPAKTETDH